MWGSLLREICCMATRHNTFPPSHSFHSKKVGKPFSRRLVLFLKMKKENSSRVDSIYGKIF